MNVHAGDFEERCSAVVRECLHERWLVSGKDFGRSEPVVPRLHVAHRRERNELRVDTDPEVDLSWVFPWDVPDGALIEWLELVAEDIWGDYCDPSHKYWVPPAPPTR